MIFHPQWNIEAIIYVALLAVVGTIVVICEVQGIWRAWKARWDRRFQDYEDEISDTWNW